MSQQLAKEGVLPKADNGRFELIPTVKAYIRYLRDRAMGRDGEFSSDIASERTRLIRENADRVAMENAKARGELIPAPLVRVSVERTFTAFKARIEAIPRKAVPRLKGIAGDAARERVLRELNREALSELSNFDFDRLVGGVEKELACGGEGPSASAGPHGEPVGGRPPGPVPRGQRRAGEWSTERAEYLRGIMDAVSDPEIGTVVFKKSAQTGGTEVLLNVIGYHIHQDPAPILVVQPNIKMVNSWSKSRLTPMLRDTPALKGKVGDPFFR
jgi:phage terminase Nu1 subunit (DNA packaging protein)